MNQKKHNNNNQNYEDCIKLYRSREKDLYWKKIRDREGEWEHEPKNNIATTTTPTEKTDHFSHKTKFPFLLYSLFL